MNNIALLADSNAIFKFSATQWCLLVNIHVLY